MAVRVGFTLCCLVHKVVPILGLHRADLDWAHTHTHLDVTVPLMP